MEQIDHILMDPEHICGQCLIHISLHRAFLDPVASSGLLTPGSHTPGSRTPGSRTPESRIR